MQHLLEGPRETDLTFDNCAHGGKGRKYSAVLTNVPANASRQIAPKLPKKAFMSRELMP